MSYAKAYVDDKSILDSSVLWRRIHPLHIVEDHGIKRPTSQAFKDSSDNTGMSVDIAEETTEEDALASYPGYSLVALKAGDVRDLRQGISREKLDHNPAHAEIFDLSGERSKKSMRAMAKQAQWVVES